MMKSLWTIAAAAALGFALPAQAADADAAQALAKDAGCGKCHAVDKDKKGPSYKKVAAKYKGHADAEAKLTAFLTKPTKVKLDDGTEEEHKTAGGDAAKTKNLVQWVLAQ